MFILFIFSSTAQFIFDKKFMLIIADPISNFV